MPSVDPVMQMVAMVLSPPSDARQDRLGYTFFTSDGAPHLCGRASALAGVLLAGAYVTGILALLQTGVAPALRVLFAPLGRMALTNYVSATPVIVLAGYLLDLPDSRSWAAVFAVCAALLVLQWACSTLWLRSFRYGPLEWVWRWVTWWRRPALLMRSS